MSTSEVSRAFVAVAPEEEEESNFDPMNYQSEVTETNLVKNHKEFSIPPKFELEFRRRRIELVDHP